MNKKILITGATGLIGKRLVNELCSKGAFVKIVSTKAPKAKEVFQHQYTVQIFDWSKHNTPEDLSPLIEDTDAVINLSGANVGDSRWTTGFKKKIYDSRIETTRLVVDAISLCDNRPECLINASATGIYGFRDDELLFEDSAQGDDFLAMVCRDWETEALKAIESNVRVVTIRAGIVLEKDDGALKGFLQPFKFHIGTYMGTGKQWVPWIHIEDVVKLYIFALENNGVLGAVNGVAPEQVTNKQFVKTIGDVLNKKILLPVPKTIMRIVVGEFANNLLTGQRVDSKKALGYGFSFRFPDLKEALNSLLK